MYIFLCAEIITVHMELYPTTRKFEILTGPNLPGVLAVSWSLGFLHE